MLRVMDWFDRHFMILVGLLAVGLVALLAKQTIAIIDYGFAGWLRGDGPLQTEWEVRAVVIVLMVLLPAAVIGGFVRSGEAFVRRRQERRWERAARRSRGSR